MKQTWSPESYQRHAGFVAEYGSDVLSWLAIRPGERILDVGCGDGRLTEKILATGAAVVGIDSSNSLVNAARQRGLDVRLMDAHQMDFVDEFDAAFSNAALHWMLDPATILNGVFQALKPGGRWVGELGGFGNVAAIISAMRGVAAGRVGVDLGLAGPWFFPTLEQYQGMLETAGFSVEQIMKFYRPTKLGSPGHRQSGAPMRGWLETLRGPFFRQFGDQSESVYQQVIDVLRPSLCDHQGQWYADYVRLRFAAVKK